MPLVWKCLARPRANVPTVGSDIVILFCASCAEQFNANVPTVSSEFAILLGASMVRGKCRFSGNAWHDHEQMYLPSAVKLLCCFARDGCINGARKMPLEWKCWARPQANVPTVGGDFVILFCARWVAQWCSENAVCVEMLGATTSKCTYRRR